MAADSHSSSSRGETKIPQLEKFVLAIPTNRPCGKTRLTTSTTSGGRIWILLTQRSSSNNAAKARRCGAHSTHRKLWRWSCKFTCRRSSPSLVMRKEKSRGAITRLRLNDTKSSFFKLMWQELQTYVLTGSGARMNISTQKTFGSSSKSCSAKRQSLSGGDLQGQR